MAQRRMFSKTITNSSQFLMMPQSTQSLYFHLGMNADDDGFCEHFTIMRMTESKPDDLKILQAKGFVQVFDEKVLVILAWKENNYLRSDRYVKSKYLEIYKQELSQIESGIPTGRQMVVPDGNQMATQVRIGKVRIGKVRIGKDRDIRPKATAKAVHIQRPEAEKESFKAYWNVFEKAYGHQLKTGNSTLQAKSIWELIDKAKEMDTDWEGFLGRVVKKFLQVIEDKPKGHECVYTQQPLPHILNGERIWSRIVGMLPKKVEKISSELTPAERHKARGF